MRTLTAKLVEYSTPSLIDSISVELVESDATCIILRFSSAWDEEMYKSSFNPHNREDDEEIRFIRNYCQKHSIKIMESDSGSMKKAMDLTTTLTTASRIEKIEPVKPVDTPKTKPEPELDDEDDTW